MTRRLAFMTPTDIPGLVDVQIAGGELLRDLTTGQAGDAARRLGLVLTTREVRAERCDCMSPFLIVPALAGDGHLIDAYCMGRLSS